VHAESLWENNSKASDDEAYCSEEDVNNSKASDDEGYDSVEDDNAVEAMELNIQALIKEQENIKVCIWRLVN
jgi:hypothetical protein